LSRLPESFSALDTVSDFTPFEQICVILFLRQVPTTRFREKMIHRSPQPRGQRDSHRLLTF